MTESGPPADPHGRNSSTQCRSHRAFLQQHFRSPLLNLLYTLAIARTMDGRGVVPTLSPNDVETAAQVRHS